MQKLYCIDEIKNLINNNKMSVIYFTGMDCGACEAIKYKIKEILKKFPKIQSGEIDGEKYLDVCAKYEVFSFPIFLLYIDAKESIRVGRNVDLLDIELKIQRYYEMIF